MKKATLFGGAMDDKSTKEYKDSVLIGSLLAKKGYDVISGGYLGMMEAVSKGAIESGGKAIGYTCSGFASTKGNDYLTEKIVTKDMFSRLRGLISQSELFVVQKGGVGTFSELFLVWDIFRKQKNPPKIYLIGNHWKNVINSVEPLVNPKELELLTFCNDYDDFFKLFEEGNN